MNRQKCQRIRERLNEVFATVADDLKKEFGIKVSVGGGRYSDSEVGQATFKLEVAEFGAGGSVETKEMAAFKREAQFYGLKAEDLGKSFVSRGEKFTICGLKPRSRKYPILAKNSRNKTYKFNAGDVRRYLGYKSDPIYDEQTIDQGDIGDVSSLLGRKWKPKF